MGALATTGYIDTALDVARDMSELHIESETISDDEDDVLTVLNGVPEEGLAPRWVSAPSILFLATTQRFFLVVLPIGFPSVPTLWGADARTCLLAGHIVENARCLSRFA